MTQRNVNIDTAAMRRDGFWWCGRCESLIPIGYWHSCTEDDARSGPSGSLIPADGRTE